MELLAREHFDSDAEFCFACGFYYGRLHEAKQIGADFRHHYGVASPDAQEFLLLALQMMDGDPFLDPGYPTSHDYECPEDELKAFSEALRKVPHAT